VSARFEIRATPEAWQQAFVESWKTLPRPPETPGPSPDDHRGWWKELVRQSLQRAAGPSQPLPEDRFEALFQALYEHFEQPGVWHLTDPDLPDLLEGLRRRGLRLGVISNFDRRLHRILRDLGILPFFENLTISSRVGVEKPHPRIFEAARLALGSPPAEAILHVGDEPRADVEGATNAGWHARRFDPDQGGFQDLRALASQ
jgi:putative hydrolase of the HAD superfamily